MNSNGFSGFVHSGYPAACGVTSAAFGDGVLLLQTETNVLVLEAGILESWRPGDMQAWRMHRLLVGS